MRIEGVRRRKKAARRIPEQEVRNLFQDGRVWCRKAQVIEPDGGTHFYIHTDPRTGARKVMIEVETLPEGEDLTCQLCTAPTWYIPPPGTVVLVAMPSGEIDHCPEIVGISDSGNADEDISEDRTLVATDKDLVFKAPAVLLGGVDASHPVPQGDSQKDALDAFADALQTYATAIAAIADPSGLATTSLTTAITLFKASRYLSSVSKTK
jgi:hypothetical protein